MTQAAAAPGGACAPAEENAAWVDIELPQAPETVIAYLRDFGRLLRLNPYLVIRSLEALPDPQDAGLRYRLDALNEMNGLAVSCGLTFQALEENGFRLCYDSGLKLATEVRAAARGAGTLLTLRENYRQPENDAALAEVDRSLTAWGVSIRRHFLGRARWGHWRLYRWWRERVWLTMTPRERRVTRLIAWATLIEFVVFLAAVLVYL